MFSKRVLFLQQKNKVFRTSVAILWSMFPLFLASCAGTGGTIGGLLPAPKFLKGKTESPLYHAPGNAFSVRLPHPPTQSNDDSYEWTYTKVREVSDGPVIGVVFGPAAFDLNLYHAVLIRMPIPKDDKEAYVKRLFSSKAKCRPGVFTQKTMQSFNFNGRTSYYAVYESDNAFIVLSLTDAIESFYVVEADISKKGARGQTNITDLINRKWDIWNAMFESFTITSADK